jgi:putative MATE family efflux protein
MGHVVRMTMTGAMGLTFIFLVDLANLFWISQVGDPRLVAAMGFAFAIQFFSVSTGVGLMIAATAVISRCIGEGEFARARHEATSTMVLTVGFQALVAMLLVWFRYPLLEMVGAEGETLHFAARYLAFTLPSLVIMAIGLVGSAALRAEGDGRRAMYATMSGGAISMVLDPVLIIWLGLGLDGAAIALILFRIMLAGMSLRYAIGTHNLLARPDWAAIKRCSKPFFVIALPAFLAQMAMPAGNYLLTGVIAAYGDNAVAGWAVVNRVSVVVFGGIFSLSGAIGGIFGQNGGAKLWTRLRRVYRDALLFCVAYSMVMWLLLALAAKYVVIAFGLKDAGADVFFAFANIGAGGFVLAGAMYVANAAFNNLGKPARATMTTWLRDGVLILPAAYALTDIFAAPGVIYAQAAVGIFVGGVAALWGWLFLARLEVDHDSA